ncbi:alpha/beta hydrolase [Marinovum sp.]|uniref:alpha/beta fold hydrolase n=1 Tax=Marinovum sp. TaxID=2024839 RepID=UPI002B265B22|nr:alpha/beta hydrolase [Marinovum sp.]
MSIIDKCNVTVTGTGKPTLVFVHGYGCDQTMWRFVAPGFVDSHRVVLYDLVGMGRSDNTAYDFTRYATLDGHAEDLCAILTELEITDAVLVGHSVGATIACLAALQMPEKVSALALVAPSPCFVNDDTYVGGFGREDIDGLIEVMDENYLGWTAHVTPIISGQPQDGAATTDLTQSFCRTDPAIAKHFGRVTFTADQRAEMGRVAHPALVLQVTDDTLAPKAVGHWLADHMARAELRTIEATGHCPHMTEPDATTTELRGFLERIG